MTINKVFYKMTLSFLLLVARYGQNTQNSKFEISLQFLKKEERDEVDFLHAENIKRSYRLMLLILVGIARDAQITQNNKFAKYLWYLKKEVRDEVEFLYRWASRFSINWCYHFWWAWPGMYKVFKILSMQYLCNISKKKWVMKLMFCMLINMKVFYKLILFIFDRFYQACP